MTKLSNAKKNVKLSLPMTKEIETVDVAADTVANTLVNRIALDASDKPVIRIALDASELNATAHSFAGVEIDYSLESTLDVGETVQTEESQTVDPMAPYADRMVKLSYSFEVMGMELDIKMVKGLIASETAHEFANAKDGPKQPVTIRCATSGELLFTAYPVKGVRNVTVVSGTRQTNTRTVKAGMSEEEKARIEAERQRKEEERLRKIREAEEARLRKEEEKAQKARDKAIREEMARIAKAQEKLRNAPKEGTDNFEQFKLFSDENGLTCMEGNHAMNVIKNRNDSNYGWKQKGKDFAEDYNKVLIGKYRVCAIAYAKTGKLDKSMKEAMRLVDKSYDESGNVVIPDGWYVIQN